MLTVNKNLKNLKKVTLMNISFQIEFKIKLRVENINFC